MDSFCFQLDLLSLSSHGLGRDAIERIFFGDIDDRGAKVRNVILEAGIPSLDAEMRCDFARLLLSLEARRPKVVKDLRIDGAEHIKRGLDSDPELIEALKELKITASPSEFAQSHFGVNFEDRALTIIQSLIENPKVGSRLINAHWVVRRHSSNTQSFVLSDRPLVRFFDFNDRRCVWFLPLTPYTAFLAANDHGILQKLMKLTDQRFVKTANVWSADQAAKFVFTIEASHALWLERHLKNTHSQ